MANTLSRSKVDHTCQTKSDVRRFVQPTETLHQARQHLRHVVVDFKPLAIYVTSEIHVSPVCCPMIHPFAQGVKLLGAWQADDRVPATAPIRTIGLAQQSEIVTPDTLDGRKQRLPVFAHKLTVYFASKFRLLQDTRQDIIMQTSPVGRCASSTRHVGIPRSRKRKCCKRCS